MSTLSLQGIIDMHVYFAPDIRERAYNVFEYTRTMVYNLERCYAQRGMV
jgi:hypothetical protein